MSLPTIIKKTGADGRKRLYVNPAKEFVKPYWLNTLNETVNLAANGVSGPQPMIVDEASGHFEIFYLMSQQTGAYTLTIKDEGRNALLMNNPVHIDTIAGVAQRPFILPESLFLNVSGGTRQLTVNMTDISGAANAVRFVASGRRYVYREAPKEIWQKFQDFYTSLERSNIFFMTTEQPITALQPGVANAQNFEFRVTSDAFFEAIKFTYATDPPNTNVDIRMWEFGSGRTFLPANTRTNINNMFGSAQFPAIPSESYLFPRDYRIAGDVVNTDVINCDVYLTITGRRIKYPAEVMR